MFTSDVHLCLSVGDTVVRRGERLLRRHLREVIKPSRGRGLTLRLLVELQITSAWLRWF